MISTKIKKILSVGFMTLLLSISSAYAGVKVNQKAPDFKLIDSNGQIVNLSDFRGKVVVLEWTSHQCPFVRKHYQPRNMQSLQKKYTSKGVVWLSIISSAEGKPGYVDGKRANALTKRRDAAPSHVLLDKQGNVGRLYGAKTTPHMFIIDKQGRVAYKGAIDSIRSARPADVSKATNYVSQGLDELLNGQKVSISQTKPYGCSIKY